VKQSINAPKGAAPSAVASEPNSTADLLNYRGTVQSSSHRKSDEGNKCCYSQDDLFGPVEVGEFEEVRDSINSM
jgi:hypothetical protein